MLSEIKKWIFRVKAGCGCMNGSGNGKVDSVDFAIYLNEKATKADKKPNVTKIQKWLYVCYGLYLALESEQLLNERPKAWDYGPAFPKVHKVQKRNGDSLDNLSLPKGKIDALKAFDNLIDAALKLSGSLTASELVSWTHEPGSAWSKKYRNGKMYAALDNHDIELDFERFIINE